MAELQNTTVESYFYYPGALLSIRGSTPIEIDIPWVSSLQLLTHSSVEARVLSSDEGKANQGLYLWASNHWMYSVALVDVMEWISRSYGITIYFTPTSPTVVNGPARIYCATDLVAELSTGQSYTIPVDRIGGTIYVVATPIYIPYDEKGVPGGVPALGPDGKIPLQNIPFEGDLHYQGAYNASTNTPPIPDASVDNQGFYWVVNVAGTFEGQDVQVGYWIVSNGTSYDVIGNTGGSGSVFSPTNVLFVDPNGDPTGGDGTLGNPYSAIGSAVDAALPGTTIMVYPGAYNENLLLGAKHVILRGYTEQAAESPSSYVTGYIQVSGVQPLLVDGFGTTYNNTGGAFRVTQIGADAIFRNFSLATTSASVAIVTDNTSGDWAGQLILDNIVVPSGAVNFNSGTGNVVLKLAPTEPCSSVFTINDGQIEFLELYGAQEIVHHAGSLIIDYAKVIGTSSAAAAIFSDAPLAASNLLALGSVNTWISPTVQSYVQKTGTCNYVVQLLTRNLVKDTWAGTSIQNSNLFDLEVVISRAGTNYTGAVNDSLVTHLLGIDNALATKVTSVANAASGQTGALTLVQTTAAPTPVVKNIVPGTGVSFVNGTNYVTVTATGVQALSSVVDDAGYSLVNNTSGQLKAVAAGDGISITDVSGVLTFTNTGGTEGGVSSVNTLVGDVTVVQGTGITVTTNSTSNAITIANNGVQTVAAGTGISVNQGTGAVTITNSGVLALSTTNGSGGVSPVYDTSGQLKYFVAGNGLSLIDNGSGTLTWTNTGATDLTSSGSGTSLVFNPTGVLKSLAAGSGLNLADDGAGTVTLSFGGSGVLTGVNNSSQSGGTPLVADSGAGTGVASIRQLLAGSGISLNYTGTAVTISNNATGVASINGINGAVVITPGSGVTLTPSGNGFTISAIAGVQSVTNITTADVGAAPLIVDTGEADGTATVKQVVPGSNIQVVDSGETITISATGGFGTVTSVNSVMPDSAGNLLLDASSVGALPISGGTMTGAVSMGSNTLGGLVDAVSGDQAVPLSQLTDGNLVLDQGVI